MRKFLLIALFPLPLIAGWVDEVETKYNAAKSAVIALEDATRRYDLSGGAERLSEEVERLNEERYKLMGESDELRDKSDKAITAFSSLDIKEVSTDNLAELKAKYDAKVQKVREKAERLVALAQSILQLSNEANKWSPSIYADWEWIISMFGEGTFLNPSSETVLDGIQTQCDADCECADEVYTRHWWDSNYIILHQNLKAWVINGGIDRERKDIP